MSRGMCGVRELVSRLRGVTELLVKALGHHWHELVDPPW